MSTLSKIYMRKHILTFVNNNNNDTLKANINAKLVYFLTHYIIHLTNQNSLSLPTPKPNSYPLSCFH